MESTSGIQIVLDAPSAGPVAVDMARGKGLDSLRVLSVDTTGESDAGGFSSGEEESSSLETDDSNGKRQARRRAAERRRKLAKAYTFKREASDIVGVVFMEVQAARDLPPERNGTLPERNATYLRSDPNGLRYGSVRHHLLR
jgi:hypothetical protein